MIEGRVTNTFTATKLSGSLRKWHSDGLFTSISFCNLDFPEEPSAILGFPSTIFCLSSFYKKLITKVNTIYCKPKKCHSSAGKNYYHMRYYAMHLSYAHLKKKSAKCYSIIVLKKLIRGLETDISILKVWMQ